MSVTTATAPLRALTREQYDFYHEQGYLILRRVFPADEVAALSEEADRLAGRQDLMTDDNLRVRFKDDVRTGGKVFDVFDPFLDLAPVAAEAAVDSRILAPLSDLYGEEACLFKDKLIFKAPGSMGATLHQDYVAWPRFPKSFVTVIVAIDPFDADNGCTEVFPGVHRRGYLSTPDGRHYHLEESAMGGVTPVPLLLAPGDIAIFTCFAPHRSAPNNSDRWRRGLFLSYNAHSEFGHMRKEHYEDFDAWRKAKMPPEVAARMTFR